MPRRGSISKRDVLPDPLYGSKLVTKLVNNVMYDGKKGVAQTIVYDAFSIIASLHLSGNILLCISNKRQGNAQPHECYAYNKG